LAFTARTSLLASLLAGLGAALVWVGTYEVDLTSWFDRGVQAGFIGLQDTRIGVWAERLVHLADPLPFAVMSLALIAVALLRRRPRTALMAAAILGGANVTTQALKRLTEGPRAYDLASWSGGMGTELWPSGHTTGAMTLALCLVLVVRRRVRPLAAAVGGCFTVAVVYSLMVLGWHLPSDSVGGFLVAASWTFLVLAVARAAERRWPARHRREPVLSRAEVLWPPVAVGAFAAVAIVGIAASRPDETLAHAIAHTSFVLGAPLLGALALAVAAGVALSVRR
jgi:membrane-associated phospholipid phosphatase